MKRRQKLITELVIIVFVISILTGVLVYQFHFNAKFAYKRCHILLKRKCYRKVAPLYVEFFCRYSSGPYANKVKREFCIKFLPLLLSPIQELGSQAEQEKIPLRRVVLPAVMTLLRDHELEPELRRAVIMYIAAVRESKAVPELVHIYTHSTDQWLKDGVELALIHIGMEQNEDYKQFLRFWRRTVEPDYATPPGMVYVPEGPFLMGTTESKIDEILQALPRISIFKGENIFADEFPQHTVYLTGYYIDKFEVTNFQYYKFLMSDAAKEHTYCHPSEPKGHDHTPLGWDLAWNKVHWSELVQNPEFEGIDIEPANDLKSFGLAEDRKTARVNAEKLKLSEIGHLTHPVQGVDWFDAYAYARWAGAYLDGEHAGKAPTWIQKDLPTESQWEKAVRGRDGKTYSWGNRWQNGRCNSRDTWPGQKNDGYYWTTAPVGSFEKGISPYGCYDMAGNVAEWCADWYDADYYSRSPEKNPCGPKTGKEKVRRGGDFSSPYFYLRCANRSSDFPNRKLIGFRCVVNITNKSANVKSNQRFIQATETADTLALKKTSDKPLQIKNRGKTSEILSQAPQIASMIKDADYKARILTKIAVKYVKSRQFKQAIQICRMIDDIYYRLQALAEIVNGYVKVDQGGKALELLSQVVQMAETIEDPYYKTLAMVNIADGYEQIGQRDKSLELLSQSTRIVQRIRDSYYAAYATADIAIKYAKIGQMDKSSELLSEAVQVAKTVWDPHYKVEILAEVASKCIEIGRKRDALELLLLATRVAETVESSYLKAWSFTKIAYGYAKAGYRKETVELISRILQMIQTIEGGFYRARIVVELTHAYTKIEEYEQAIKIAQALEGSLYRSWTLAEIANIYTNSGNCEEAARAARAIENAFFYKARELIGISDKYLEAGRSDKALEMLLLATRAARRMKDSDIKAGVLSMIAIEYIEVGQSDKALEAFLDARRVLKAVK